MTYEELVKNNAGSLVERLVTEVLDQEYIEVRFEEDEDPWSMIQMTIYEEDKEIALCLHANERWVLSFGYYDDDDEFIELEQPLTAEEKDLIPEGLRKVMLRVLVSQQSVRLPGNFLSGH